MNRSEAVVGIGGAAGDGIASAGDAIALSLARQGLHVFGYNSYQSLIRGGHCWLRMRISGEPIRNQGDKIDVLLALNQDTLDRHLQELEPGGACIYNVGETKPSYDAPTDVQLCPLPVEDLCGAYKQFPIMQNTVAVGAMTFLIGLDFSGIESVILTNFEKKGQSIVTMNVSAAQAGYDYAKRHFTPLPLTFATNSSALAVSNGNDLFALGAVMSGVKFYCAYPMSPSTGILHWMAKHAKELGICVKQVEDEISVINMTIGAAHMGVRAMCATSGGGYSLMTEALGMAGIIETPVVVISVQRGGPSTGLPTKTEQADLNQAWGASQGEYPRVILAPTDAKDCFLSMPTVFNLADKYQCPVTVLSDKLLSESTVTLDPALFGAPIKIDRAGLIVDVSQSSKKNGVYYRYENTETGISPRAIPGLEGHIYAAETDEHDEDGVRISDVATDTVVRKKMVDKRNRKMSKITREFEAPYFSGPIDADLTLIGWGSTKGVIAEAVAILNDANITTNHLHLKYLVPFQVDEVSAILSTTKKTIVVENNSTGQFARHLLAETGHCVDAHIRKYDGEPFGPKHIVGSVHSIIDGEVLVNVVNDEPSWRNSHPTILQ